MLCLSAFHPARVEPDAGVASALSEGATPEKGAGAALGYHGEYL